MEGAAESMVAQEVGMDRTMLKLFNEALKADRCAGTGRPIALESGDDPLERQQYCTAIEDEYDQYGMTCNYLVGAFESCKLVRP